MQVISTTAPGDTNTQPSRPGQVFAMVAGEDSGDQLGAELIEALKAHSRDARYVGIGGPRMRAAGMEAWHGVDALSVLGFAEVLRHLPRLLRLRRSLAKRLLALQPDVFIGIDAPDFNLGLEKSLKQAGIPTVHYVSPSIWAWREGRAKKIGASADCVLCLFPMEPPIYATHGVAAEFVGHPLADRFPLAPDRDAARRELGLAANAPVLAVLPGSRVAEIKRLGPTFLKAAGQLAAEISGLQVLIPAANEACRRSLESCLQSSERETRNSNPESRVPSPESRVPSPLLLNGHAHRAMVAADVVLLASGTAALEAMLAKRPMVVGYRLAPTTHAAIRGLGLLKTNVYALPNILTRKPVVPELMQRECTPAKLAGAVLKCFRDPCYRDELCQEFERMHLALRVDGGAAANAARAIVRIANLRLAIDDSCHAP